MPDSVEPDPPAGLEQDLFLEDADATFRWRNIPLEGWVCLPIFWVLAAVVFWQFFTRYVLDNSAVWTEEVARQLLILLTFFGAGYALRTRANICISYFVLKLGPLGQRLAQEASSLFQFAFYAYACYLCIKIAEATKYQTLMSVDLSKSVVYYIVSVSLAGMALRAIVDVWAIARGYVDRRPPGAAAPAAPADKLGAEP